MFNYEKLHILGILGDLENTLEHVSSLCANKNLEFAPVTMSNNNPLLPGIYYPPLVDITIDRFPNKEASMVLYSLDKQKAMDVMREVGEKSGFKLKDLEESFVRGLVGLTPYEKRVYRQAEVMAGVINSPELGLEKMWGILRYTNFLQTYQGFSEEETLELIAKKFNLSRGILDKFREKK
jgi:hypothetical protein